MAATDVTTDRTLATRTAYVELLAADRRLRGREQMDLSFTQVRALVQLADRGELTAGEFAKAAEVTPASATGMLDQLEKAGIVSRQRSAEDRRRVVVTITDEGQALVDRKRQRWNQVWDEALAGVDDDALAAAADVMRRLADAFSRL